VKLDLTLRLIEAGAIIAFALSGFLEAARKRMDVVGVIAVAFITAFGGGTLRDILLDRRPLFWVEHQEYVLLIFVVSLGAMALMRGRHHRLTERAIQVPDALGLGLFSVSGTSLALEAQLPLFVASLMGVITAVFGGVMRDIICNEVPTVFRDHRPYALCSFAGCWVFLGLHLAGGPPLLALAAGAGTAAGLRLLALARGWTLPAGRGGTGQG
jgi:uncharacterized membrane protein YeiH